MENDTIESSEKACSGVQNTPEGKMRIFVAFETLRRNSRKGRDVKEDVERIRRAEAWSHGTGYVRHDIDWKVR